MNTGKTPPFCTFGENAGGRLCRTPRATETAYSGDSEVTLLPPVVAVESARELAVVMAAAGLASNLAALKALAGEGIQRGHMRLHNRRLEDAPARAKGETR